MFATASTDGPVSIAKQQSAPPCAVSSQAAIAPTTVNVIQTSTMSLVSVLLISRSALFHARTAECVPTTMIVTVLETTRDRSASSYLAPTIAVDTVPATPEPGCVLVTLDGDLTLIVLLSSAIWSVDQTESVLMTRSSISTANAISATMVLYATRGCVTESGPLIP